MIAGETSDVVAVGIADSGILTLDVLPFQTGAVVGVPLRRDVPIVSGIECQFVLLPFVILRCVLVEVVVGRIAIIVCLIVGRAVEHAGHRLDGVVIHRGTGGIVHIIVPLVQSHAPCHVFAFALQFCGQERLVDEAAVETRHATLHMTGIGGVRSVSLTQRVACRGVHLAYRHGGLIEIGTESVVIFQTCVPLPTFSPAVSVEQRDLIATAGGAVVEADFLDATVAHIHIKDVRLVGKVGTRAQSKTGNLPHGTIADIDERRTGRGVGKPMTVAVMINRRKATATLGIFLGECKFINLRTVLILRKTQLKSSGVKILVSTTAVGPSLAQRAKDIDVKLLLAEVVRVVVHHAVERTFGVRAELSPRVHGVADVTRGDGCFRNLEQSAVLQTSVTAPVRVDVVRIGVIDHRQTILKHVHIAARQTDGNFARSIGAGSIEHHVATVLLCVTCPQRVVLFTLCTSRQRQERTCCERPYSLRQERSVFPVFHTI